MLSTWDCGLYYNHPTRGQQLRPDGVTWLQTKVLWDRFGPMSDKTVNGVTGDVSYMDDMMDEHVPLYLVPNSISDHLVRGASRGQQK